MAYHRDWLKTQIKGYLHDSSVDSYLDTWIDLGAKRASQILQCFEMEDELTLAAGSGVDNIPLDSTVRRVLGVQWQHYGGQYVNLRSVPRHNAGQFKGAGQPQVYLIQDHSIYPLPFNDGNFKAQIIREVVIPANGTTEVDALTAYPFIFLNAALAEAYDWKQNPDMLNRYETKWADEAGRVTANYMSERIGDTPSMRAM